MAKLDDATRRRGLRAAAIFVVIIATAIVLFKVSGLDVRQIHERIAAWGSWGPVAWTLCMWLFLPLLAPVSVMIALSGLAFGPWIGFAAAYAGVVGGGILIFWISRLTGRKLVDRLLGDLADKLDGHVNAHGLFGTLYLRMLPVPFAPVSYLAGVTRMPFLPYAIGTALGIAPAVLVNAVVAGTLGEVWLNDQGLAALFQPRTLWAGIVVILSLVAPLVIEAIRRRVGDDRDDASPEPPDEEATGASQP